MTKEKVDYGREVKRLRESESLSQVKLAAAYGTSQPYFSQLENGSIRCTKEEFLRIVAIIERLGEMEADIRREQARVRDEIMAKHLASA